MLKKKKGKWGGRRTGAGRKPSGITVSNYSIRIHRDHAELLKQWGGGDMAAGLRWLVNVAQQFVHKVNRQAKP